MVQFLLWYISITLLGWLTFPLAWRLFPALADRGYSMSRALGLLLWGFFFWLSATFGIVRNEPGGQLFALVPLAALSFWAMWSVDSTRSDDGKGAFGQNWKEMTEWVRTNLRMLISVEVLFLLAFAAWAFVRANNPETTGTEKPMEIAFINAILHSPYFPPHDPWLSGFAISYYYFGYVLTAMLAMFTGTSGSMAFNLMLALVFALSVTGSYGLLYNLLSAYWGQAKDTRPGHISILGAFLGPLFLLLIGNVEGFLELLHAYGIGWTNSGSNFWLWLKMKDLSDAPVLPLTWNPRFWFWWRASRVLHDYDLRGNFIEVIDEFPFFSYLLGDLHPHVLAMPFGLLAVGLALNLYLGGWRGNTLILGFNIPVRRVGLALAAVVLGGLAFLNTWDFPVYLALVSAALILFLVKERGWDWDLVEDFLKFSIPLAIACVLLYLPFFLSFSSQAGGILPNIIFPTRGVYVWIMFGTLLAPIFLYLFALVRKQPANWKTGFFLAGGLALFLWIFSTALGLLVGQTETGQAFISSQGYSSALALLYPASLRRLEYGTGLLTLILLLCFALAYLAAGKKTNEAPAVGEKSSTAFVLMLILFGGLLVLAPEFVYLRDQFGSRMNTVFKFYYQAWTFWSLAAAFGFVVLMRELLGLKLVLFTTLMGAVLFMGLTYPALSLPNKTDNFNIDTPDRRTLDGFVYMEAYRPDDYAAIKWLSAQPQGAVAEAVGGSYTEFARVSTYSGQPSVLGWPGHESQWRGGYAVMGNRANDIAQLYTTSNWSEADAILKRYDIRYVFIGSLERTTYAVDERKFAASLSEVYRQGQTVIYEIP